MGAKVATVEPLKLYCHLESQDQQIQNLWPAAERAEGRDGNGCVGQGVDWFLGWKKRKEGVGEWGEI